jgi:integrase
MKIKHLKIRQDSQTFAFQKKIPLRLVEKARLLNLKQVVVMPLGLAVGASEVMVATAIEQKNKQFETLVRFLEQTDYTAVEKAQWESTAKAYLEVKGLKAVSLRGVDSRDDEFDYRIEEALGIRANQDDEDWQRNYPEETKLPRELVGAVVEILKQREGTQKFHLFSDAIDYYKAHKEKQLNELSGTEVERNRKKREWLKDLKRLDKFLEFTGNQEFTQDNVNENLRLFRNHLTTVYPNANTAKRNLNAPAAAIRLYADDVVTHVAVTQIRISGQSKTASARPVLNLENELSLLWKAAHRDDFGQFERLSIFGIFCGGSAAEICQTEAEDIHALEGYYVLGGTKKESRRRPVVIINETHLKLLTQYKSGYVVGEKVALQQNHSQRFAKVLREVTGNEELVPYSCRHTGKHLADTKGVGHLDVLETMFGWNSGQKQAKDNYGNAGIFTKPYIEQMKQITIKMLEDLPDYHSPTPDNILRINGNK